MKAALRLFQTSSTDTACTRFQTEIGKALAIPSYHSTSSRTSVTLFPGDVSCRLFGKPMTLISFNNTNHHEALVAVTLGE